MSNDSNVEAREATESSVRLFPAIVVAINDRYTVVINRGNAHGVRKGQNFLIYGLSEKEIIDPETKENLGYLEIVRGSGSVVHVQEKLATIESNRKSNSKRVINRKSPWSLGGLEETETVDSLLAFEDPEIGDKARPI